ncbi:MAG: helix-turn-helix transcriptional regulator [Thermodesulfobacteriota bacterium]
MAQWTFLTNHALVLIFLNNHSKITGHELASLIGITERAVRRVIADLEAEGYIEKQKEGRRVRYTINHRLRFRHPAQRDKEIGILLEAVGRAPGSTRFKPSNRKGSNPA